MQKKRAVTQVLQNPQAVQNGRLTPLALNEITRIDPGMGLQLNQQQEQIRLRDLQFDEKKQKLRMGIETSYVEAYDRYLQSTGGNKTEAQRMAARDRDSSINDFEKSGQFSANGVDENEVNRLRGAVKDPDQVRATIRAMGGTITKPPDYMTQFQKRELDLNERRTKAIEDRERRMATGGVDAGGSPTGASGQMMQDPSTGQRYMVNSKVGKAWELDEEGQWKATNVNNLPKALSKIGNVGVAGSREAVFTQRLIQAANQASKDLENVTHLPISADRGPFGAFGSVTAPSLLDAGKVVLGNKMTSEDQQVYNAMSTGFQRTLAAIESAGLMPSGSLTHQMDAVIFKPGDTNLTKLHKLAQTRQIVESGMEVVLTNPRISDAEKDKVREIVTNLKKSVPFTHVDLVNLSRLQQENPDATLRDVFKERGLGGPKEGDKSKSKSGKSIIFKNGNWEYE